MNIILQMWNKPQKLKVVFDLSPKEPSTREQVQAFNYFLRNKKKIIAEIEEIVNKDLGENPLNIIIPKIFYIQKNKNRVVGIICDNKNDLENDYVIIIENEKMIKIGTRADLL